MNQKLIFKSKPNDPTSHYAETKIGKFYIEEFGDDMLLCGTNICDEMFYNKPIDYVVSRAQSKHDYITGRIKILIPEDFAENAYEGSYSASVNLGFEFKVLLCYNSTLDSWAIYANDFFNFPKERIRKLEDAKHLVIKTLKNLIN